MAGRINNVKNEITAFLKEHAEHLTTKINESPTRPLIGHMINYEREVYFIPSERSIMDENDELLLEMLIATFLYE